MFDPFFLAADLVIYHFGIYYDLFNLILIGNGRAKQVVRFHNVTPAEHAPESARPVIRQSLEQMHNIAFADQVWTESEFNRRTLAEAGLPVDQTSILPLPVFTEAPRDLVKGRGKSPVRLIYIGRFVPSKGVIDLLEAASVVYEEGVTNFELHLIGNVAFSDASYLDAIKSFIGARPIGKNVRFLGEVEDEALRHCLQSADAFVIASYHEGFCVPILEAFQNECFVIAYDAGNIPDLVRGRGQVVRTGDVAALARQIRAFVVELSEAAQEGREPVMRTELGPILLGAYRDEVRRYAQRFSPQAHARQFIDSVLRALDSH